MIENLIIHPKDVSTHFLKRIYSGLSYELINRQIDEKELIEKMKTSKRIMFMGHGSPGGLFGFTKPYMTLQNLEFFKILKDKPDTVYIWCNADKYVETHGLTGVVTGMIISEVTEAYYCGIRVPQVKVTESNNQFAEAFRQAIYLEPSEMVKSVIKYYVNETEASPVVDYNKVRIYHMVNGIKNIF